VSEIRHLIADMCPNGVPFTTLGDVGNFVRGHGLQKKDLVKHGVGAIHYGQIFTVYGTATTCTRSFVDPALASRLRRAKPGDLVIATTSENDEDVCKAVAWIGNEEIAISGDAYIYGHTLEPLYVSFFFQSSDFQAQKRKFITGTKVKRVSGEHLSRIRIPVPPLAIQRKIAAILTEMGSLRAELEAELKERYLQYAHYRDALLTFAETGVPWVTFGDVATIVRGASPRPIQAYLTAADDGINWVKIGDVAAGGKYITSTAEKIKPEGVSKSREVNPGDFVLSNSMSFGRPYIMKIHGCIHDGWLAIKNFDETFNSHFLYHLLRTSLVYKEMAQRAGAGTVQNLNAEIVKLLVLPAPELAEQARIAAILDRFDILVNDPSIGLPAELAARRKQFEYYRDKLLTFEELPA
jgi:type I restriction enzyme, S subunit